MSLVLNTNLYSLQAQNSLASSGTQLSHSLAQLSSGLRINNSADDAAGFAIAQGMTSQINGLNQAAQNANDGVSLTQTATGALGEVVTDLQTMRNLAVESLNASNSATDRADLNSQFQQLAADINSVASNTQFNGVNLLDGSFQGATFQIGANAGQTITVSSVDSAKAANLGALYSSKSNGGYDGLYSSALISKGDTAVLDITVTPQSGAATSVTTNSITLTGDQRTDLASVAAAINQATASAGIVATVGTNRIVMSASAVNDMGTVSFALDSASHFANSGVMDTGPLGVDASDMFSSGLLGNPAPTYINGADVLTVDNSNKALTQIDAALQQLATSTAQLGAYQNRFDSLINGLKTGATNLSAAKSAIVDTDYAQATSALSKAQILQRASTAMVSQANLIPQGILALLRKIP